LEYQYTVAAKNCTLYSGVAPNGIAQAALPPNPQVIYPGCTINPTIVECGSQGTNNCGATGGDSPNNPWVFNAGDTVTVNPPAGVTIQNVVFELYTLQGNLVGQAQPVSSSPFMYTWSPHTEGQTYMLRMTVTVQSGTGSCSETHVKYIQDQEAAACAFQNVTSQPLLSVTAQRTNVSTAVVTVTQTFSVSNAQAVALNLAKNNATLTWGRPAGDTGHPDLKLVNVSWGGAVVNLSVTAPSPAPTQTVTAMQIPSTTTSIPANGSMSVRFTWQYLKSDDCAGNNCSGNSPWDVTKAIQPTANLLTKLCIEYTITTEQGVIKHCNLLGQSNSTNNPTGCD